MSEDITMSVCLVKVEEVQVVDRHRRDLGDLGSLVRSIEDVGLINPITLSADLRLIAGGRRLAAFQALRWPAIPARVVANLADASAALRAERDENTCRKDMLPSEIAALGAALYEVEASAAKARQLGTLKQHRSSLQGGTDEQRNGEAAALVGEALGMSRSTYTELRFAHNVAHDESRPDDERELGKQALAAMDEGKGIQPTATRLRGQLRSRRTAQEIKASATTAAEAPAGDAESDGWIPRPNDRSPESAARRRELIRELAAKKFTSAQIAARLGINETGVRRIARDEGIDNPADQALGAGTRKKIDSNRIVRETVNQFDGLEMALDLIDYDQIDRSEIEDWTVSLTQSIRVLNRLNKKLKEMVQ